MAIEVFGRTVVLAPHPDDETLGCGASLLRLKEETSHELAWVLMTRMTEEAGFNVRDIAQRKEEIERVTELFQFDQCVQLPFVAATLDAEPLQKLVQVLAGVFDELRPETLLVPFPLDAHSDHGRCFRVASACSKWFRRKYLHRIMCYETLSETGFNLDPMASAFSPNCYIKVPDALIDRKIEIMRTYKSEMSDFPFPRSDEAIRSLARIRGSECGVASAEAFMLIREVF